MIIDRLQINSVRHIKLKLKQQEKVTILSADLTSFQMDGWMDGTIHKSRLHFELYSTHSCLKDETSLLLLSRHCLPSKKVSLESFLQLLAVQQGDEKVRRSSLPALMKGGFIETSALSLQLFRIKRPDTKTLLFGGILMAPTSVLLLKPLSNNKR